MFVSCECCVLSCRGLCVGLITRPEKSYRVWCVWVWLWIIDNSLLNLSARCGWVVKAKSRPLYTQEWPGTHSTEDWVGRTAGLDGCGKSPPHRESISRPSSPQRVVMPTALSQSAKILLYYRIQGKKKLCVSTLNAESSLEFPRISFELCFNTKLSLVCNLLNNFLFFH
jgi:hypothetical protein